MVPSVALGLRGGFRSPREVQRLMFFAHNGRLMFELETSEADQGNSDRSFSDTLAQHYTRVPTWTRKLMLELADEPARRLESKTKGWWHSRLGQLLRAPV
jgi:hypothetical protein